MSVLIDKNTKILVQGITGAQASFHVQRAMKYGTNIVAGVVPNKNDDKYLGLPLFNTVLEAKEKTGATVSLVFIPAKFAKSAILEAINAEISIVVVITSGIPISDMIEIKDVLKNSKTILIGPNTPGIITPKEAYAGVFPDNIHKKGNIGVVSRSSTLTYEVVLEMGKSGFGESSVIGLGDDFIIGTSFVEIIRRFNEDKATKAVVLIAGVGGNYEIEVAQFYRALKKKKPVIALIVEDMFSIKKSEGLATEIICRGITSTADKIKLLKDAGITVVESVSQLKEELQKL